MQQVKAASAQEVDGLVDIFDTYSFVRELVANSLDANCARVDVRWDFQDPIAILLISDDGEGMSSSECTPNLTTLKFSTRKSQPKKIGRYGFGFVSVFAWSDAVVVDTAKELVGSRLMFRDRRNFDRISLNGQRHGTIIQLIKEMAPNQRSDIQDRVTQSVNFWCKHCRVPVFLNGEPIRSDFFSAHPDEVKVEREGLRFAIQPATAEKTFSGFYTHGLTICEKDQPIIPGVSFKLDCDTLSYTFARNDVLKDRHYRKAMARLAKTINEKLRPQLWNAVANAECATRRDELLGALAHRLNWLPRELDSMPLVPCVDGERVSLRRIRRSCWRWGAVYWDESDSPAAQSLLDRGIPVLLGDSPGLRRFLDAGLHNPQWRQASESPAPARRWLGEWLSLLTGRPSKGGLR